MEKLPRGALHEPLRPTASDVSVLTLCVYVCCYIVRKRNGRPKTKNDDENKNCCREKCASVLLPRARQLIQLLTVKSFCAELNYN